jgi:hypothetical protein
MVLVHPGQRKNAGLTWERPSLLAHLLERGGMLARAILGMSVIHFCSCGFTRTKMSQEVNASLETVRHRLSSHWNEQLFRISSGGPAAEIKSRLRGSSFSSDCSVTWFLCLISIHLSSEIYRS